MAAGLSSIDGRRELQPAGSGASPAGLEALSCSPCHACIAPTLQLTYLLPPTACIGHRAVSSWELVEPHVPSRADPGHWAPQCKACAGGGLSAGVSAVLQPQHESQAPHALVTHWLTVFLPAESPCAKGLLALVLPYQLEEGICWRRWLCTQGQLPPQRVMQPPGLLEPRVNC